MSRGQVEGYDELATLEEWKKNRLLSPKEAQHKKPYRRKSLLSGDEILTLKETIERWKSLKSIGVVERDSQGRQVEADSNRTPVWTTAYAHTDRHFQLAFPELLERIRRVVLDADEEATWGVLKGREATSLNFRTIEFHRYESGGSLSNWRDEHFDDGSLITIDIMLSDPDAGDFVGGELVFPTEDGSFDSSVETFEIGDAMLFVSHKPHNVRPVVKGVREVLVLELWEGDERCCAHRCLKRSGDCSGSMARLHLASVAQDLINLT